MTEPEVPRINFEVRQAFAGFFSHVEELDRLYHWPEPDLAVKDVAFNPDLYASHAQRLLELRRSLTERWVAAGSGPEGLPIRREIARWVVIDWGGIKGNADETLECYVTRASGPIGNIPLQGIASFSKILAVAEPDKYAIYDARVASALNALQILGGVKSGGVAFPTLPTQNKTIEQFNEYLESVLSRYQWQSLEESDAYGVYLVVLRNGESALSGDLLQKREMLLFAMAERLCKKVMLEADNV